MCWIEVPNRVVCEEVQARIDSDPRAVLITDADRPGAGARLAIALAFLTGVLVGWLWSM
jgi:hypothetical protein